MLGALKRKGPRRFPGQSRGDGLDRGGLAKASARRANASICCVFSSDRDSRTRARSAVSDALPSMRPPPVQRDAATLSRCPHVCRSSRPLPKSHDCHPMQALPAACIHAVDAGVYLQKKKSSSQSRGLAAASCSVFPVWLCSVRDVVLACDQTAMRWASWACCNGVRCHRLLPVCCPALQAIPAGHGGHSGVRCACDCALRSQQTRCQTRPPERIHSPQVLPATPL